MHDRETCLKWHVETRSQRFTIVKFHTGKVMERKLARLNQPRYTSQSLLTTNHFQRGPGVKSKKTGAHNIRQEQILKLVVVRKVQEYVGPFASSQ
jgi:hypothetical protein